MGQLTLQLAVAAGYLHKIFAGSALLHFDCYRMRKGNSVSEGLGSMFREVRAIRFFAALLDVEALATIPETGHGGDYEVTSNYFHLDAGPVSAAELIELAGAKSSMPSNVTVATAKLRRGEAEKLTDWMKKAGMDCYMLKKRSECALAMLSSADLGRLSKKISKVRRARGSGKVGLLALRSDACPTIYYNVAIPCVDDPLRQLVASSRRWRPAAGKIVVALHVRMGDLLTSVLLRGKSQQVVSSIPVTKKEVLDTIRKSYTKKELYAIPSMPEELDACAMEWNLAATQPACEANHKLQFGVRYYLRVLEQLHLIPAFASAESENSLEIHVVTDAPPHWFAAITAAYPAASVHGNGDGTTLLTGEPSELDYLIFADVIVIGEGNLGRLAGLLNVAGVVIQPTCQRSGSLSGATVVHADKDGTVDARDLAAKWQLHQALGASMPMEISAIPEEL